MKNMRVQSRFRCPGLLVALAFLAFGAPVRSDPLARQVTIYRENYGIKPDAGEEALNTRGERVFQVLTALENMKAWDRRSSRESVAFTYLYFWTKAYEDLFTTAKYARFNSYDRGRIDIHSAEEQKMAWRALDETVSRIEKKFGKPEVPWGQVNVVVRGGVYPLEGASAELFGVLHPDEGVEQDNGPKQVWSLLPFGQSEHPSSPHYNDQAKLHSERKVKRFWIAPAEILEHTESVWGDKDRIRLIGSGR